jgi:integrase
MPAITKRLVDSAAPGRHYDEKLSGFGLYVGKTGARSYFFEYRPGRGRGVAKRRISIGKHGAPWTAESARQRALQLLAEVQAGGDPLEARKAVEDQKWMGLALDDWLSEVDGRLKPRTAEEYRRLMTAHALPLLAKRHVADVTRSEVAKLHYALRQKPFEANNCLRVLSSFFTWCERHGLRPDGSNPCRHVVKYREKRRERFLSGAEMARLGETLADAEAKGASPFVIAAVRLLVFTGARLREVLGLRWDYVDLEAGYLRLPDSKTGAKAVHLNAPARQVLHALPRVDSNPHVIVGGRPGAALVNLEKPWRRIRSAADLNDVRLHDLRHTHASVAVAGGLSLPLVGALLGHSQPATTARYAHFADDPVKAASELVGQRIADAMRIDRGIGEVVPIRRSS